MATGIPKQRTGSSVLSENLTSNGLGLTLDYQGKRSLNDVMMTPPADFERIWPSSSIQTSLNSLYFGDNLSVLAALREDPSIRGRIRLVYIDPPYATGGNFQSRTQQDAYEDLLLGAHYVEFLRERLILLRDLLAEDGSIYVHLDKNMAFAIKLIMDEVFGPKNFRSWITRKKCNPKNYTSKSYGNVADYILFYTKTDDYVWHRPYDGWTDARAFKEYSYIDDSGRRYKKVPIHAPGTRNGETGKPWRGMLPPPGKHWQYVPTKLDELDAKGEIYWSPAGNSRRKVYLEGSAGVPVQDIWMEFKDAHNQNIKITGYSTEKNPLLLQRIIEASSNPGDLVLDCFGGSGTTFAVAAQTGRHWIGIDNSSLAIATICRRFACGLQPMGDFASTRLERNDELEQAQLALLLERRTADDYGVEHFTLWADRTFQQPTLNSDMNLEAVGNAFLTLSDRSMEQG